MNGTPIKLIDLATACYFYGRLTKYDNSYSKFINETKPRLDLSNENHRLALLKWLNSWGCRQFARKDHNKASAKLAKWFEKYGSTLPADSVHLWQLEISHYTQIAEAYDSLSNIVASTRSNKSKSYKVSIGPTGAAKILFAIRPHSMLPWDEPIRKVLNFGGDAGQYIEFLKQTKTLLISLEGECQKAGFRLEELPAKIGRENSSVPKLIDEYYWVTITQNWTLPDKDIIQNWSLWASL